MKQNEERIHVCYALSDPYGTYAKFPGTSLCSLFENTASPVSAHILHDDTLTPENRERFLRLGEQYGQEILFYHVTELAKETWGRAMALFPEGLSSRRYTSANMYRLLLPALLPPEVDKAIYLDGDTVVHMDVAKLWGESIDSELAAVSDLELLHHYGKEGRESKDASYLYRGGSARLETVFNAGVLVFRLDLLRKGENLLLSGVQFLSEHRDCKYYDNDILIAFFGESYTHLPWYCNIRLNWDIAYGDGALVTGIYHYLGRNYRMDGQDPRQALFLSYYRKSPWCDERTLVKACRLAAALSVAFFTGTAWMPTGGNVVDGGANITVLTNITSSNMNNFIKWESFSINNDETVKFDDKTYLNYVVGNSASGILGTLESANGTIYLINPNGILFGKSATISVGSGALIASTTAISDIDTLTTVDAVMSKIETIKLRCGKRLQKSDAEMDCFCPPAILRRIIEVDAPDDGMPEYASVLP